MSVGSGDLVEIYRARDLPEAHALRIDLEREGISAHVDNEILQGAVGELAAGWTTAPRVLVGPADGVAARAVLEEFLQRMGSRTEGEDTSLRCLACGASMGEANACPACGWSYGLEPNAPPDPDLDTPFAELTLAEDEPLAVGPGREDPTPLGLGGSAAAPALARRAVLGEVGAVLAVGIVPQLFGVVFSAVHSSPLPPYWLDALHRMVMNGCTIFVTLYLIYRSGEPWERFGLPRPRLWDLLIGIGMFLVAQALWLFCCSLVRWEGGPTPGYAFPRPQQTADYALMLLMYGASGFAEELVTRAYLVTRFEHLLRSRAGAVLLSASLFAAYHAYQSVAGVAYTMAFGVAYGVAFLLLRRVWPLAIGHALCNIRLGFGV